MGLTPAYTQAGTSACVSKLVARPGKEDVYAEGLGRRVCVGKAWEGGCVGKAGEGGCVRGRPGKEGVCGKAWEGWCVRGRPGKEGVWGRPGK